MVRLQQRLTAMTSRAAVEKRIRIALVCVSAVLITMLGAIGWWAATSIDDRSISREAKAVRTGLEELLERVPVEQDTSAVWTDSVRNLRINNGPWLADNLAEWVSDYFGHDRVYLLDPENRVLRAAEHGQGAPLSRFRHDQAAIAPMVETLRAEMAQAAAETPEDSTDAISGLGIADLRPISDNTAAIVSVRPVVPDNGNLQQALGTEFLHVSVVELTPELAGSMGERFDLEDLRFTRETVSDPGRYSVPALDGAGRIVGFFSWLPYKPAFQLITHTWPMLSLCLLFVALSIALLLVRLKRSSERLSKTEAQAEFLAYHDALTHLPNRALFEKTLDQALSKARQLGSRVVLHCIDLDHFKSVNDTLGHPAGDALLIEVAARLKALIGENDLVARLGGDEFAIIETQVRDISDSLALAQRIVETLGQPFTLSGREVHVGGSVGLMAAEGPSANAEDLQRQADLALYESKAAGRGRYMLYGGELGEALRDRLATELALREALQSGQGLAVVYQPIFSSHSGEIEGAEALVRWDHPTRGRISPAKFVRLAEERGLIATLGLWVMRQACLYTVSSGLPWVAVNVSPVQFRDERFADRVFEVLESTGLAPARLEIEVTEGLLLQNSPEVQKTLRRLRERGVRIALDDFGTGYSSITYLRTYGIDKLKIDQSFTAQLGEDGEIDSIVRSIIDLGRAMKMKVTAEGVETERQRAILLEMGCDQLQGYLLARPMPQIEWPHKGSDLNRAKARSR